MKSKVELKDSYKSYTYDQDKARTPTETAEWVKSRFQEAQLDILRQTVRIDSGRLDIPVFISVCGADASLMTGTKKQMGKGCHPCAGRSQRFDGAFRTI